MADFFYWDCDECGARISAASHEATVEAALDHGRWHTRDALDRLTAAGLLTTKVENGKVRYFATEKGRVTLKAKTSKRKPRKTTRPVEG